MLLPVPSIEEQVSESPPAPLIARFLPSLTDLAFLMPLMFLFVKLSGSRTMLGDGDTGWHIRAGEWMLAHGRVPWTDIFSFTRPGAPWFAWEWLWDLGFAVLHRAGGMAAVVSVSIFVICLANALVFRLVRKACENSLVAIAVTLLATGGCAIHWLARPHLFTILFFAITLQITASARAGRTGALGWLVPLTLLWTNLHGGFFVVFLVIACYVGSDLLNAAIEREPGIRRRFLAATKPWLLCAAACFAVTFANPYGWRLHQHVVQYIFDPYQLQHISEFQAVNFHSPVSVYFEPLMILGIMAAIFDIRARRFDQVFLFLGWLHLALIAQRNIPLFAIAAAPIVARGIVCVIRAAADAELSGWIRGIARKFLRGSAGFEENDRIGRTHLISAGILGAASLILIATPARPGVIDSKTISTYDPAAYPEKALSLLRGPDTQRIFAEDEWGDYLIYQLFPLKKVFVDGRSDFYGAEFGERYLDLLNGKYDWQKTLDRYGIDTIVIAPKFALSSTLKLSRDWRVVYDDHVALVFRRNARIQGSLVTSNEGNVRDRSIAKTHNRDREITQHIPRTHT